MSDILGMIAHGVETFRFKPDDYLTCAKHVKEIVEENEIETIVLGLPNIWMAILVKEDKFQLNLKTIRRNDWRNQCDLSWREINNGSCWKSTSFCGCIKKEKKQVIDKMAAVAILQGYLDRG